MLTERYNKLTGRNNSNPTGIPKAFSNRNKAQPRNVDIRESQCCQETRSPELLGAAAMSLVNEGPGQRESFTHLRVRAWTLKAKIRIKNEVLRVSAHSHSH